MLIVGRSKTSRNPCSRAVSSSTSFGEWTLRGTHTAVTAICGDGIWGSELSDIRRPWSPCRGVGDPSDPFRFAPNRRESVTDI